MEGPAAWDFWTAFEQHWRHQLSEHTDQLLQLDQVCEAADALSGCGRPYRHSIASNPLLLAACTAVTSQVMLYTLDRSIGLALRRLCTALSLRTDDV